MNFHEIVDALPFADFSTPEELSLAQKLISEEMGNPPESEPAPERKLIEKKIPGPQMTEFEGLKRDSELLEIRSENLEISSQFGTQAWLQLKAQILSLRERTAEARAAEGGAESVKRRRLAQIRQAAGLRQAISEWSDLLANNGQAERAVAQLESEISRLVKRRKVTEEIWEEINKLLVVD